MSLVLKTKPSICDCFVRVPRLINRNKTGYWELLSEESQCFVSSISGSSGDNIVDMGEDFAKLQGLKNGEIITFKEIVPNDCKVLTVSAKSLIDPSIQDIILTQVKIVKKNQIIPIYFNSMIINLKIVDTIPTGTVYLKEGVKMVVVREEDLIDFAKETKSAGSLVDKEENVLLGFEKKLKVLKFESFEKEDFMNEVRPLAPNEAFVFEEMLEGGITIDHFYAELRKESSDQSEKTIVKIKIIKSLKNYKFRFSVFGFDVVFVPKPLRIQLYISSSISFVYLKSLENLKFFPNEPQVLHIFSTSEEIKEKHKEKLRNIFEELIGSLLDKNSLVFLDSLVFLVSRPYPYIMNHLTKFEFKEEKIDLIQEEKIPILPSFPLFSDLFIMIGSPKKVFEDVLTLVDYRERLVTNPSPSLTNFLITGSHGSGKTMLINQLAVKLAFQNPFPYFVQYINCSTLSGKSYNVVMDTLQDIFLKFQFHSMTVLFVDNLEYLGMESGGRGEKIQEPPPFIFHIFIKFFEIFSETSNHIHLNVVSVNNISSINKYFLEKQIFAYRGDLDEKWTFGQKEDLFKQLLNNHCDQKIEFDESFTREIEERKLEKFTIGDISALSKVTCVELMKEDSENVLDRKKIKNIFKMFTPFHLRSSKLRAPPQVGLKVVGGIGNVKESLIESFIWPSKYSFLFKKCPVPYKTGVLLYGPPGVGKTFLASAVASECKMNLICVKGPELLKKYIGASEEAVRETFQKARQSSPCLILFDELDSLAGRRGQTSTGVTDRVVNQMLVEIDGVENLEGVFILGSSSRPDLIDPALLRPGRISTHLYCQMPNEHERLEILKIQSNKFKLDKNVNLSLVAKKTQGYSGADLKGLMYCVVLECIEELKKRDLVNGRGDEENGEIGEDNLIITINHFLRALKKHRPSLSNADLTFYQSVNQSFNHNRTQTLVGTKQTLA